MTTHSAEITFAARQVEQQTRQALEYVNVRQEVTNLALHSAETLVEGSRRRLEKSHEILKKFHV